jgi:hypothetical protein
VRKEFLKELDKYKKKPEPRNDALPSPDDNDGDKKKDDAGTKEKVSMNTADLVMTQAGDQGSGPAGLKMLFDTEGEMSFYRSVDYISLALDVDPKGLSVDMGVSINPVTTAASMILELFKTGTHAGAASIPMAAGYTFFSFDPMAIENNCSKLGNFCQSYGSFKTVFAAGLGIDYNDFLVNFSGVVNCIIGRTQGIATVPYAAYLPMKEGASMPILDKARAHLKSINKDNGKFGEQKNKAVSAIWIKMDDGKKIFICADKKGFYLGSDMEIMTAMMSAKPILSEAGGPIKSRLDDQVFLLTQVKKDSILGGLLAIQSVRYKEASPIISKMGDIYLLGKRRGRYVSFSLELELKGMK